MNGSFQIYLSGGACLRVNEERVSNQIYEYVPNTHVFQLTLTGEDDDAKWVTVLDLSRYSETQSFFRVKSNWTTHSISNEKVR